MRPSQTPNRSTNFRILKSLRPRLIRGAAAGLMAAAILGTSGCKSVPFSLPKPSLPKLAAPDLSKLAFWKSENLVAKKGNLPKPPSLSFDSSPIKQAVASSKKSASQEIQALRQEIASTKAQLTEPIREPYKFAAKNAVNKLAGNSKLDLGGSSSRNKLPTAASVDSKITQAQRDFQAALASSSKAVDQSIGGKLSGLKGAANDFSIPKSIKSAKANVDDSLMAVNKSLYNAQGKLASAAKDPLKGVAGDDQLSLFEQRLQKATDKVKAAPAQIASSGSSSKSAANAFGGVAPPKPLAAPTNNALAGSGTKIAQAPSKTVTTPTAPATAAVSAEVAELKAQLAQMRLEQQKLIQQQKLAAAQPATGFQTPAASTNVTPATVPPTTFAAREFVADLTARPKPNYPEMRPSNVPLRTASSANNVLSSAPQNVLRGNFSPVANPVANNTPQYPSPSASTAPAQASPPTPTSNAGSQYPSTPYNSYGTPVNNYSTNTAPAPTFAPPSKNTQVSFQEDKNSSNLVIKASTPVEPAQRHVSEVNIPDAVLKGTSNYAPGTVHALR